MTSTLHRDKIEVVVHSGVTSNLTLGIISSLAVRKSRPSNPVLDGGLAALESFDPFDGSQVRDSTIRITTIHKNAVVLGQNLISTNDRGVQLVVDDLIGADLPRTNGGSRHSMDGCAHLRQVQVLRSSGTVNAGRRETDILLSSKLEIKRAVGTGASLRGIATLVHVVDVDITDLLVHLDEEFTTDDRLRSIEATVSRKLLVEKGAVQGVVVGELDEGMRIVLLISHSVTHQDTLQVDLGVGGLSILLMNIVGQGRDIDASIGLARNVEVVGGELGVGSEEVQQELIVIDSGLVVVSVVVRTCVGIRETNTSGSLQVDHVSHLIPGVRV